MKLSALLAQTDVLSVGMVGDAEVTGIQLDSRKIKPGNLFVCTPGMTNDAQAFLPAAAANGASCALVYDSAGLETARLLGLAAAQIPADLHQDSIWRICDAFFGHPTREMKVVGVTGTNGKTTVAWLMRDMLKWLGMRAGYLGTLGFQIPGEERELPNTTPFAVDLYNLLAEARDKGVEALAMEVSSHALAERRADGVEFDAAVFTNLTQDHLDFHGSMEAYEAAKWRLFNDFPAFTAKRLVSAINVEDPSGERLGRTLGGNAVEYGRNGRDLACEVEHVGVDEIRLKLRVRQPETRWSPTIRVPLGGDYNVSNSLSAAAGMLALGFGVDAISQSLANVRPVPGRFEAVPNEQGIGILVDYAHTPDALEKLLDAVRPLTKGRVITVFGCGGDRDATKRPLMARAASERSDLTVVTSDNPRTEDPAKILGDILPGIMPGRDSVAIPDRAEAVAHAVHTAHPGDVVVIAGKGHENYQIIGRTKHPMDDRELARQALIR